MATKKEQTQTQTQTPPAPPVPVPPAPPEAPPAPTGDETTPDETTAVFDPADHAPDEVFDYLAGLDDEDPDAHGAEVVRIYDAEEAGLARTEVLEAIAGTPEDPEGPGEVPGAPLEPPAPPADDEQPAGNGIIDASQLGVDMLSHSTSTVTLTDENGGQLDADTLFKDGPGQVRVCTQRIIEHRVHPNGERTSVLVMAAGATLPHAGAEQIRAAIRALQD